jgi:lauroyl/myristoyl acyltransferase
MDGLHSADYDWLLPMAARLPLSVGYALSSLRGRVNAQIGRDWRSVALRKRHVEVASAQGFRSLFPAADEVVLKKLVAERFMAESREEFEGALIAAGRVAELRREIIPDAFLRACLSRDRGLVLLTPHFDSFTLGIVFLGLAGVRINAMSSSVIADSRVAPGAQRHFSNKYRGMERFMNGGRVLDQEEGLKPFFRMLDNRECLVVLADAPASSQGAYLQVDFMGAKRSLAGGALRMARRTGSKLGAFVCRFDGAGRYLVKGSLILDAADACAANTTYDFLTREILASPGLWWAADMLPLMPLIEERKIHT